MAQKEKLVVSTFDSAQWAKMRSELHDYPIRSDETPEKVAARLTAAIALGRGFVDPRAVVWVYEMLLRELPKTKDWELLQKAAYED